MTDQIADLLIRIKNASLIKKEEVRIPYSKMKEAILNIFLREGFVKNIDIVDEKGKKTMLVELKHGKNITHIKQISKPGQRIYARGNNIPKPLRGMGLVVISTSKGVISSRDAAKEGIGGELICEIW